MTQSNQDAAGPARPRAVTPQIPRRPKDVPPAVTIDPVGQVVADLLPVTVTGSANPGITWSWNPREPGWDPGPMVTYTGVQVTTDAGLTVDATPVGTDWAPWSATVFFPSPGPHWVSATGSTAEGEVVASARQPVPVADTLWHTVGSAGSPPAWQAAFDPVQWRPGWAYDPFTAVSCAAVDDQLQLVGIAQDGQLWHNTLAGTWAPDASRVEAGEQNDPGPFVAVGCGGVSGELQVVAVDAATRQLWHTIRHADGTWQPFFGLVEANEGNNPGQFFGVSAAGVGPDLHVVGICPGPGNGGVQMWHTIRYGASGSSPARWQGTFDAVPWPSDAGPFTSVTCAGVGDDLHVIALDRFGRLAHMGYVPGAGPWIFVEWMDYVIPPEVWPFTTISCAAMGGDLHLVSVAEQLWHSVKPAGGGLSWEISAPVPAGNSAELGPFGTVGCAAAGGNLHVAATLAPFQ